MNIWLVRYWRLWLGTRMDLIGFRLSVSTWQWIACKAAFWTLNLAVTSLGLLALVKRRAWTMAVPVLYTALFYIPFHDIETRFTLPVLPFLLIVLGQFYDSPRKSSVIKARP